MVNSDLYSYSTNMIGIIVSTVLLCCTSMVVHCQSMVVAQHEESPTVRFRTVARKISRKCSQEMGLTSDMAVSGGS